MKTKCNRCGGIPEFGGTLFQDGKVFHRYRCLCGATEMRYINPIGYDLDDPRAAKTMILSRDYGQRLGIYERSK